MDPREALPPENPPAPAIVPPEPPPLRTGPITCEFCECSLTPHGHALKLSDKARKWRDHADDIDKLNAKINELETKVRTQQAEIAVLTPSEKHSFFG
jgi:hypothetical protein